MEKMMHLAAQYLAAAGISFLEKEADDSHTNLGFSTENGCLQTHALSKAGDVLSLNYKKFTLEWSSQNGKTSFRLDGATHEQVLEWLKEVSNTFLKREYEYIFHYDLPYEIGDNFMFKLLDASKLRELMHLRILAQYTLEKILEDNGLESLIRVWPHHFDTGAFSELNDGSGISIGFGLAPPDTLCNEHYLYISGYNGRSALDTSNFDGLSNGSWKNEGFKGAILPVSDLVESETVGFFQEAIDTYKTMANA